MVTRDNTSLYLSVSPLSPWPYRLPLKSSTEAMMSVSLQPTSKQAAHAHQRFGLLVHFIQGGQEILALSLCLNVLLCFVNFEPYLHQGGIP